MRALVPILFLLSLCLPARAELTEADALQIARTAAISQNADFGQPGTTVRVAFSDKIVALTISDPYRLNGEVFWKTYTHYELNRLPTTAGTTIGTNLLATQASAPATSHVAPDLRPKVLDWLAYWDGQSSLDPDLVVGARATKAWGFYFRRPSVYGPAAFIGVDADGVPFRLNVNGPLVPWPPIGTARDALQASVFERLFSALD